MLSDAISVHLEPVHNENDANQNDTFGSKKWGGPCPPGPPGSDGPVPGFVRKHFIGGLSRGE